MSKGSGNTRGTNSGNTHTSVMKSKISSIHSDIDSFANHLESYKINGKLAGDINKHIDSVVADVKAITELSMNSVKEVNDYATAVDKVVAKHYSRLNDIAGTMMANANDAKGATRRMYENAASALHQTAYNLWKNQPKDLLSKLGEIEGEYIKQRKWK